MAVMLAPAKSVEAEPQFDVVQTSEKVVAVQHPTRHRFSPADFESMIEAGIFNGKGRLELVDGIVITMPPVGLPHSLCLADFHEVLGPHWRRPRLIKSQATHRFEDGWRPEPDLALLDERSVVGAEIEPLPVLVIEIAETSLTYDLGEKRLRYARAGVKEYVVAALPTRQLHVFREPFIDAAEAVTAWRDESILKPGDVYSPLCLPDLKIEVASVLPEVPDEK